jgi:hypothetical protein
MRTFLVIVLPEDDCSHWTGSCSTSSYLASSVDDAIRQWRHNKRDMLSVLVGRKLLVSDGSYTWAFEVNRPTPIEVNPA